MVESSGLELVLESLKQRKADFPPIEALQVVYSRPKIRALVRRSLGVKRLADVLKSGNPKKMIGTVAALMKHIDTKYERYFRLYCPHFEINCGVCLRCGREWRELKHRAWKYGR